MFYSEEHPFPDEAFSTAAVCDPLMRRHTAGNKEKVDAQWRRREEEADFAGRSMRGGGSRGR